MPALATFSDLPAIVPALADDSDMRALWLAVLNQALEDERREPTGYVGSTSFREVCELAGLDPAWAAEKLATIPLVAPPKPVAPPIGPPKPIVRKPRLPGDFGLLAGSYRRRAGLSQREAARLVGTNQRTFSAWETMRQAPPEPAQAEVLAILRALAGAS